MNCLRVLGAFCALGTVLLGMVCPVQAEQPTVVVSISSLGELIDDADYFGQAVGQPGLKGLAEGQINSITGGPDNDGIDRDRSIGFYWTMVENAPGNLGHLVVFIPVTDGGKFEALVKKFLPDVKVEDDKWSINVPGVPPLSGLMTEEYFYLSNASEALEEPADPEKISSDEQDISIELNLAGIPKPIKQVFLSSVEQNAMQHLRDGPKPSTEAEAVGQKLGAQWMMSVIKAITNDGERFKLAVDIDSESGLASLDLTLTGAPKTPLASAFATYGKIVPAFAAVPTESAPLQLVISHPTTGVLDTIDELFKAMQSTSDSAIDKDDSLKDDGDRKAAKDVANRLFTIIKATVKTGALHSVLVLDKGEGDTARIVGGTKIAKGDDASKLWDDVVKLSKESPQLAKVKTDADKHAGARIHAVTPDLNDKQTALFGEEPLHLAIRADSLWLSMGGGNLTALKSALDASGKKASKSTAPISLRVKPATLVTIMEKDDQELLKRAEAIAGNDSDVLNLSIAPTDGVGIDIHFEFGVGLFGLSGK